MSKKKKKNQNFIGSLDINQQTTAGEVMLILKTIVYISITTNSLVNLKNFSEGR